MTLPPASEAAVIREALDCISDDRAYEALAALEARLTDSDQRALRLAKECDALEARLARMDSGIFLGKTAEEWLALEARLAEAGRALADLHESLFIGSERGLSNEALRAMATFAKRAALAAALPPESETR